MAGGWVDCSRLLSAAVELALESTQLDELPRNSTRSPGQQVERLPEHPFGSPDTLVNELAESGGSVIVLNVTDIVFGLSQPLVCSLCVEHDWAVADDGLGWAWLEDDDRNELVAALQDGDLARNEC